MQLRYVFTELGNGLRRNLSMHIAVILTLFVSLTLVGLGVLLNQEATKVADRWGSQLQVAVYLCSQHDGNPACTGEVTDAQQQQIQQVVDTNSQVSSSYTESKQQAPKETTGEYVDDATVTAKVKTAIASDVGVKAASNVNVETFRGVVQLSGFADTDEQASKAASAAKKVNGVKSVKNDIRIKSSSSGR